MNITGLYGYNNFVFEIARLFDEQIEENTPINRMYEIGLLMIDHIDSK